VKKESAIIDCLAKQPTILSQACVQENVQSGWVASGFIDPQCFCMPVLHSSQDHFHLQEDTIKYISSFASLMLLSYNNGNQYLYDHDLIKHGFNPDLYMYGNKKIRDVTISQENHQHAQCLTSAAIRSSKNVPYYLQMVEINW
jgi:hypothetical protein